MLSADQTLNKGRYRIANQFGTDGAGALFEAYDTINKSNVVLREISSAPGKVLTTSQRDAAEAIFVGNAKVLTKFRHGNLVAIQDYFTEVGNQYLVLENIVGFDLTEYTKGDRSRPSVAQAVKWTLDLLQALEYLHKLSPPIIHGNISPKNIRFRDERTAKLLPLDVNTSFTLSSEQRPENSKGVGEHDLNYQPLERYWHTLGQLTQRSILRDYDERSERILLHKLDARSDMYALAACIYHVLTGVEPVSALDRACALHEGKADPLVAMAKIDTLIPEVVSAIFMKALSVRGSSDSIRQQ